MQHDNYFLKGLKALPIAILVSFLLFIVPWQMPGLAVTSSETTLPSEVFDRADTQLQQDIEKEKQEATAEAESKLDREASAAIEETRKASAAIEQGKIQDALGALERATGKLDILLARYPELGLVPVSTQVAVIDVAPLDTDAIERIRNQIKSAINAEDYPTARELLNNECDQNLIVNKRLNLLLGE